MAIANSKIHNIILFSQIKIMKTASYQIAFIADNQNVNIVYYDIIMNMNSLHCSSVDMVASQFSVNKIAVIRYLGVWE